MADYTLGGVTLSNVREDTRRKSAQLMMMTMPASDSNATLGFDFMGVEKTVSISGSASGTSGTMQTLRASLDALCNGEQTGHSLTCDFYPTITVFVQEVETKLTEGVPYTKLDYRLQLVEGTQ